MYIGNHIANHCNQWNETSVVKFFGGPHTYCIVQNLTNLWISINAPKSYFTKINIPSKLLPLHCSTWKRNCHNTAITSHMHAIKIGFTYHSGICRKQQDMCKPYWCCQMPMFYVPHQYCNVSVTIWLVVSSSKPKTTINLIGWFW